MSNKLWSVTRTISFNGNMLEVERNFGIFSAADDAEFRAQELYDSVATNVATKGLCFNFFVREVVVDGEWMAPA
jgi:hypothetical protein